jgi:HD-GYP domain-containing protein (c-di-GMP phosphodiesterase class II)
LWLSTQVSWSFADPYIAIESRIIHVADAFVAMTLDRPYRRAM